MIILYNKSSPNMYFYLCLVFGHDIGTFRQIQRLKYLHVFKNLMMMLIRNITLYVL